jgi:N-acetylglutamate synthase-like GNAT family acetyltransferase
MKNGSVAQLRGMAVSEDCQGKGIGKMLIEKQKRFYKRIKFLKFG